MSNHDNDCKSLTDEPKLIDAYNVPILGKTSKGITKGGYIARVRAIRCRKNIAYQTQSLKALLNKREE